MSSSAYMHNASTHGWLVCWRVTTISKQSCYDHTHTTHFYIWPILNPTVCVLSKWILQWESVMTRFVKHCSSVLCNLARPLFHTTVAFIAPCCHGNCIRPLRTLLFLNDSDCSHCGAKTNMLYTLKQTMQTIYHTDMRIVRCYINPAENIH